MLDVGLCETLTRNKKSAVHLAARWEPGAEGIRQRPCAKWAPGTALGKAPGATEPFLGTLQVSLRIFFTLWPPLSDHLVRLEPEQVLHRPAAQHLEHVTGPVLMLLFTEPLPNMTARSSTAQLSSALATDIPAKSLRAPRPVRFEVSALHSTISLSSVVTFRESENYFNRLDVSWISLAQMPPEAQELVHVLGQMRTQSGYCLLQEALLVVPQPFLSQARPGTLLSVLPHAHAYHCADHGAQRIFTRSSIHPTGLYSWGPRVVTCT